MNNLSDYAGGLAVASELVVSRVFASTTALAGYHYFVGAAGITITLPLNPTAGDEVGVSNGVYTDALVARNGENIAGAAEDFLMDVPDTFILLRYIDATEGWTVANFVSQGVTPAGVPVGTENQTLRYNATTLEATSGLTVDASGNVSVAGTLSSTGQITGTLATAAQPNITSLGTIAGLSATTITGSGDLAINTDTLFVDVSAGNVGIGTASPSEDVEESLPRSPLDYAQMALALRQPT